MIKAENDWRDGWPQVAMHQRLPLFLVIVVTVVVIIIIIIIIIINN